MLAQDTSTRPSLLPWQPAQAVLVHGMGTGTDGTDTRARGSCARAVQLSQKLQQAIPEASWSCNKNMLTSYINPAKPKCSKTRRIHSHLLHPDSHNCMITQINERNPQDLYQQLCQPHEQKIQDWRAITYTDGSVVPDRESNTQIAGAGIYTPLSKRGRSMEHRVLLNGVGPTNTMNRAELSATLVALHKKCKNIATDSASSLLQIKKQPRPEPLSLDKRFVHLIPSSLLQ